MGGGAGLTKVSFRMSLDLSDLVAFFESEPTLDEHDVPWQYSGALFRYVSGEDSITCRIAPGEGLLSVSWRQAARFHCARGWKILSV